MPIEAFLNLKVEITQFKTSRRLVKPSEQFQFSLFFFLLPQIKISTQFQFECVGSTSLRTLQKFNIIAFIGKTLRWNYPTIMRNLLSFNVTMRMVSTKETFNTVSTCIIVRT
jgi:hypothetical protein